jgi:hypothetical protein
MRARFFLVGVKLTPRGIQKPKGPVQDDIEGAGERFVDNGAQCLSMAQNMQRPQSSTRDDLPN